MFLRSIPVLAVVTLVASCNTSSMGTSAEPGGNQNISVEGEEIMTVEASEKQSKTDETSENQSSAPANTTTSYALATFAGGCFWCMEPPFESLEGVKSAVSGYTGGEEKNPSYRQVAGGKTGHTEAVQVTFDPERVSYETLVRVFWSSFNPTDLDGQFADRGRQYRPAVFYHDEIQRLIAEKTRDELNQSGKFSKPVKTQIQPASQFYPAEDYHQDYYLKNSTHYKAYAAGSGRKGFLDSIWGVGGWPAPWPTTFGGNAAIKDKLTPLQYQVTRENGTEAPFRNEYWDNKEAGIYVDLLSGEPLFASIHKFKSGTGWPSFTQPLENANILELQDNSHGMTRVEVRSRYGGNHLGHVFNDGPAPTGLRYCMNSAALRFIPFEDMSGSAYAQYQELFK